MVACVVLGNINVLTEVLVASLFLAVIVGPLCTGAIPPPATTSGGVRVGRRAGAELPMPAREEDAVLIPATDVTLLPATVGVRETGLVAGKGRVE